MFWTQVAVPLIIGLLVISWQNVQAGESVTLMKANSTKPGNKTINKALPLDENFLYTYFACRDKQNGLRLPVAGSCMDYYECQEGMAKRLTCKPGMHFSNMGLSCLDSRLSKCKAEQLDIKCEGPCCGRNDGLYPAKESCSDYLICVNGQSFRKSCGRMLQFSAENGICDIPERTSCTEPVDTGKIDEKIEGKQKEVGLPKPTMYMISHRVCQNHSTGFYIAIDGSCNKFYICIEGVGYLKSCGNLQFNRGTNYCDARTRIYCPEYEEDDVILDVEYAAVDTLPMPLPHKGKKPISQEEQKEVKKPYSGKKPKPVVIEEEEDKLVSWGKKPAQRPQSPEDNVQGSKKPQGPTNIEPPRQGGKKQPKPSHFQTPLHVDVSKEKHGEEEVKEDTNVLANSNICSDEPVGALMAMPGECSKYIRCRWDWYQRRVAEVLYCPKGMHFNAKSKYCEWPENAGCMVKSNNVSKIHKKNKFTEQF